ncbi:MAG TPA: ATP-binding protein, partial [Flavisolibacter sp.]|nr:ATP-binding protein [Flavisolibacter sp.]
FPFTINKPWWQTVWFYVLVNMLIITILYLLIRNRAKQELRIERIRRNISSDLHDDIGATLSSINFYIDLARSEKDSDTYLQQIKENVAHVIASLDDLVWSINPKNDSTEQFIHRMKNYAVPLLRAVRIQCHFSYDPQLLHQKLTLNTKRNLYLLFKEMVNNVAKHSRCYHCVIRLQYQHGQLCLNVTDDGQGFDPLVYRPDRNGLFTMQDRARRLNGEIEIKSAPARGSEIEVTIPV